MGRARFTEPLSIRALALTTALMTSSLLACSIVDDEPPSGGVGDTDGVDPCIEQLQVAEAACLPGMNFESMVQGGEGSTILIDDPGAAIGVGPDAWLVQVGAAADYVASYQVHDATCTACCGWCKRGESVCHQGFNQSGTPTGCLLCLAYGTPDMGAQCAAFMNACAALDETGADDEDGADETGAETDSGVMALPDPDAFDCGDWDLEQAVVPGEQGEVIVDAAVVEMAAAQLGEPLAKCDGTRFRQRSDGYFEVSALTPSSLLARIGLEQGDVILGADGESMHSVDRVVAKAMDSFMGVYPTSKLTLVVFRGGEIIDMVVRIQ